MVKPARASDPVAEAQKFIYGKGARQDCDRGLREPARAWTAYRWFALALRKDPDNQSVQTDLQKLWGEMTQPERQLAIKLSQ